MSAEQKKTLETLWRAIKEHNCGETFWLAEILLATIKQETGYNGERLQ